MIVCPACGCEQRESARCIQCETPLKSGVEIETEKKLVEKGATISRPNPYFTEAKKEFTKAMDINPYFHYCYYNIGLIWEKLGQPDSAIVWQTKAVNLQPPNSMAQYMAKGALGLVYGKLKGDVDKAIPLLKEALANKPDDTGYHENLGICYAMKRDFDNSIKEFETSLKLKTQLKKEDSRIFMNLALSWQNKGNKEKADENFQKAFQLDPSLKK